MLCGFQYGCPVLCGLAPVVVLRSFGDRVEVFAVSVSLSPSLGRIQPWPGVKPFTPLNFFFSKLSPLPKPTVVKIGPPFAEPIRCISCGNQSYRCHGRFIFFNPPSHPFQSVTVFTIHIFIPVLIFYIYLFVL